VGEEVVYNGSRGPERGVVAAVEWLDADTRSYALRLHDSDRAVSTSAQRLQPFVDTAAAEAAAAAAASAAERAAMEAADAALAAQLQEEEDAAAAVPASPFEALMREALASSGLPPELLSSPQTRVQLHVQTSPAAVFIPQFGFVGAAPDAQAQQQQQQMSFAQLAAALAAFGGGGVPHFGGAMGGQEMTYEQLLALQERLGGNVPRGASEAQLAAIPVRTVAEGMAEETCSICLCAQEPGERLRVMPCGHTHHAACLERWLQTSRKCPVCRHELE